KTIDPEGDYVALARAWKSLLNAGRLESSTYIAALTLLLPKFDPGNRDVEKAFSSEWLNAGRSRCELDLRLGGQLYMEGRRRLRDSAQRDLALYLLRSAIDRFDDVEKRDALLKARDDIRRRYRGMRGAARLALARSPSAPRPLLEGACADFEASGRLGDR